MPRTVWGIGTARTLRVHWILHELGLPYDTRAIQSRTGETQTEEYLALNPRGKIPTLVEDDLVLAESGAIAAYLADAHAPGRFAPPPGTRERAVHDQWCVFVLMELDATSLYVVRRHGEEKYHRFMQRLDDPAYLKRTHDAVVPNFLQRAIEALRPEAVTD